MKNTTPIIIFYIVYFLWLFTVTYLTPEVMFLNYFTGGVTILYFLLLREKGDLFWFSVSALIPMLMAAISWEKGSLKTDINLVYLMPMWLPLAWGTTVIALRKFYLVLAYE